MKNKDVASSLVDALIHSVRLLSLKQSYVFF